jgi:Uri superfamily endonuclease
MLPLTVSMTFHVAMWLSMLLEVYFTRAGSEIRNSTEMTIEPKPGTYALVLSCTSNARIRVGRLGPMRLRCGYYVYLGSALGPGGLRARIAHHQKISTRPHWHIDYLRAYTRIHSVWLNCDGRRHEHEWAVALKEAKGSMVPLPGFGASDCGCPSHLYFFERCPAELLAICGEEGRIQQGWMDNNKVPSWRANSNPHG